MKKHLPIILFLSLLCIDPMIAQDLKELTLSGKAKKLDSELVARRDQNGNYCAAIQVISDMDGFTYDSNDGIVGKVENKPGKDIVYLTSTERVLEVFKSGYEPLKIILSANGISLSQRAMWQIRIAGEEAANILPVTFRYTPEDANLFVDGESIGTNLTKELSMGEHNLRIEREGYQTIEETINVNNKNVFFEWEMNKALDAGVQITTTPEGATVYLDGVRLGESPVATFYPPGTYPIKITKEGYVPIENQMLEVIRPQTQKAYTLEENVGYLTVNTRPEATVYFNEEIVADPTNVKFSPQIVNVKVTMPKAEDIEEQVVIKKDDDKVLNLYPDIQTGTIQVAVTPFDAQIELTGDAGEFYTAEGMKIFENIPIGDYIIKVTYTGYISSVDTLQLKKNEIVNKRMYLEQSNDNVYNTAEFATQNLTNEYGIEMVFVKGGTFTMGNNNGFDNEKPEHEVTLDDFYIGKYEVTIEQWRKVMEKKPHNQNKNHPVAKKNWKDVQEFINLLRQRTGKNYRLPTEAEWEYAARGGVNARPTKYSGSNNINEVAWNGHNTKLGNRYEVGLKKPNELGIYDMSGNYWEWCNDYYEEYSAKSQNNPKGPANGSFHVLRGGGIWNWASYCKVSTRFVNEERRETNIGFRLALDP